ncbi:sialoadhesin-like isoform X2 [Cheilinus undulatus]|uniref:sialoadhesin-like isoform X2 n=1 Tax=Cheilinus undulatus TaxID=241271 RepID=UPI001BD47C86|nr:sialoadhesin-like isoform X2 [Cheilinus undulatus]
MVSLKWLLFFIFIFSTALQTKASAWKAKVPSSVKGLLGSCVVIPCTFDYPDPKRTLTEISGMWTNADHQLICHTVQSKVIQQFRGRTELLGDVRQKNCTLKIDPLKESDRGPLNFRIEMANYEKYSYRQSAVTIAINREPDPISLSVKDELVEGETVSASCSASHSCPFSPPLLNWSLSGKETLQHQQHDNGQWQTTSTLTFHPTNADHGKALQCNVTYKGEKHLTASKVLKVKYAPMDVKVEYKSDVKEGESVRLKCSSDANPPANSYDWSNETGAQLHHGKVYMLRSVSRHTGALYCTASNTVGQGKSSPVHLNVLHAPEIKTVSSCSSEADMVKCVCIAESRPPSMVHFVLSDRVLPKAKVEKHGPVTIGTIQAKFGSSEFVHCLANNTQGSANLTLYFPVNSKMQSIYVFIAIGTAVILVILFMAVGIKKCRGRSEAASETQLSTMKAHKDVEHSQYAATQRQERAYDDVDLQGIYTNDHVYGNMETDPDDAIYANV